MPGRGRQISDGPVVSVVPPPGQTVYAEILTTSGTEVLSVRRLPDVTIRLDRVGDEPEESAGGDIGRGVDREGCHRSAYPNLDYEVTETTTYNFRVSSTPRDLTRAGARNGIVRAARNVFDTRNGCRMGGRVPVALKYGGRTGAPAQGGDGLCGLNDNRSVVAFGDLKSGVLAAACTISEDRQVLTSDIKINRADYRWTINPGSRSCSRAYDVESVMTHEWGPRLRARTRLRERQPQPDHELHHQRSLPGRREVARPGRRGGPGRGVTLNGSPAHLAGNYPAIT